MIDTANIEIPISRQCDLLGLSRSGYYYQQQGQGALNLQLMNLIDEQYTKMPFYGVEKMTVWLKRERYPVNVKRIRRLMRKMGLEAIYPKPKLSTSMAEHKKYPIERFGNTTFGSSLVCGHNLHTDGAGLSVSRGDNGLV